MSRRDPEEAWFNVALVVAVAVVALFVVTGL